jgi:hypothetical protein
VNILIDDYSGMTKITPVLADRIANKVTKKRVTIRQLLQSVGLSATDTQILEAADALRERGLKVRKRKGRETFIYVKR